jgi:hypothetical protein
MNTLSRAAITLALAVAGSFTATCGWADITLHIHYVLVNGDTVTRANYYGSKRVRATAPDGREYIFLVKEKRVAVIDHPSKTYWEGPMSAADSVVDSLNAVRYREVMSAVSDEQKAAWPQIVQSLNDSTQVQKTSDRRNIAGVSCERWTATAGSWMSHSRWVASTYRVPTYTREIQRILLSSVEEPMAKGFAKLLISTSDIDGLPLAASTTYRTMASSGSYSWETFRVDYDKIPESVWKVPSDYRRMQWSDVKPRKR